MTAEMLTAGVVAVGSRSAGAPPSVLDEVWMRKSKRRHVWEFAEVFAVLFLIIGAVRAYRYDLPTCFAWCTAAGIMLALGKFFPMTLLPVWRSWMTFAEYLSKIVTTVILSLLWVVMVIPVAVAVRLFRIEVLDMSFDRSKESYWKSRGSGPEFFKNMERQF